MLVFSGSAATASLKNKIKDFNCEYFFEKELAKQENCHAVQEMETLHSLSRNAY